MDTIRNWLGFSTVSDLNAIQKMIDHVNHTVEEDFTNVQQIAAQVKAMRAKLDAEMQVQHDQLTPPCNAYAGTRSEIHQGKPGSEPLSQRCLQAQGQMKTMVSLGQKVNGCMDACAVVPTYKEWVNKVESGTCDTSTCHSSLMCVKQLESLSTWLGSAKRDDEVLRACATQGFDMYVQAPAGMMAHKEEEAGAAAEAAMPAPDAVVLALSLAPDHRRRKDRQQACNEFL